MRTIKFGIIGCGLMGKEFAGAAGRWMQVNEDLPRPEIVAVCDANPASMEWFKSRVDSVRYCFLDYKELLACDEIEAVYCAVPHNMHQQIYVDIINSKKHFMGEKPFGIDKEANAAILEAVKNNPGSIIRCASEFPYYPGCQRLINWIREERFGSIIEAYAGLNHSSDIDPLKPINWKRKNATNGIYGCMGDLGIHTEHVPFRMGWKPINVYAKLQNIVTQRPDNNGNRVPCDTWDNATLICDMEDRNGSVFPMTYEMKRLKPGAKNSWYLIVHGMKGSAKFTTDDANAFYYTDTAEQAWCREMTGNTPLFSTITGKIFEFGFTDAILQMWVAFVKEIVGQEVSFGCFLPEETRLSHQLHTAAIQSYECNKSILIK